MRFRDIAGENGMFKDGDWIEKKDQDDNGNVRLIQLADIGAGYFKDKSDKRITETKAIELNCTYLKKGDILITRLGEPLCKACIFPYEGLYITAVDIAILRIGLQEIDSKYLVYLINSPWFKDQVKQYESGTTRKRISRKNLDCIDMTFPPIEEQQRIVTRIEELFSELDSAVETLRKAKQQLEVYRQAVLKEAFDGLNESVTMDTLAVMIDPQPSHRTPAVYDGGIPYIGIGDIDYSCDRIKFSEARKVSPDLLEEHRQRYRIEKGDFIMGKIGTIGKPYRLPLPQDYLLSANVILIKPDCNIIIPDFLYWQFSSWWITSQLIKGSTATSQPAFGIKKARLLNIKICGIEKQRQIVNQIYSKLSICDSIEKTINEALQQAEAMRQSILKKAFEGRL